MSRKAQSLKSVERGIAKAERELFMARLYENVYVARKRPGKSSVRAVESDGNVELIGADGEALDRVYNALTSGKGEVSATKLQALAEDELLQALQHEYQAEELAAQVGD